jgi:hypothetical protein
MRPVFSFRLGWLRRSSVARLLSGLLAMVIIGLSWLGMRHGGQINQAACNRIHPGMTPREVHALLAGSRPAVHWTCHPDGKRWREEVWYGRSALLVVFYGPDDRSVRARLLPLPPDPAGKWSRLDS